MGKSIDPMGVGQRKRSRERSRPPLPALIVSLSLRPGIPWRVALQHCPPPLPRLAPCLATRWWSTKPPPQPGWGIFNRRKRDFSSGLDTFWNSAEYFNDSSAVGPRLQNGRRVGRGTSSRLRVGPMGSAVSGRGPRYQEKGEKQCQFLGGWMRCFRRRSLRREGIRDARGNR